MGEAKRRKKLAPSWGKSFGSSLTVKDYLPIAERLIPEEVIKNAAVFSWNVQHDVLPEEYKVKGWPRGLCEILWNPDSREWLANAAEMVTEKHLGAPNKLDYSEVVTILAKSLSLAALNSTDESGFPLCLVPERNERKLFWFHDLCYETEFTGSFEECVEKLGKCGVIMTDETEESLDAIKKLKPGNSGFFELFSFSRSGDSAGTSEWEVKCLLSCFETNQPQK